MSNYPINFSLYDKLCIFRLTASPHKVAAFDGLWFGVVIIVLGKIFFDILPGFPSDLLSNNYVIIGCGLLFGLLMFAASPRAVKKQRTYIDEYLGIELTRQDRIDLYVWFKKSIKPKAARLRPILAKYVQHTEDSLAGLSPLMNDSQKDQFWLAIVVIVLNINLFFFDESLRPLRIYIIMSFLYMALLYFPPKVGVRKPVQVFINRRKLRRVAEMRQQL